MDGWLYFTAGDPDHGLELWRSDGSTTELVADVWTGFDSSWPQELTPMSGWLYFTVSAPDFEVAMWRSNGGTTELVADVWPGSDGSRPRQLTPMDGWLYFSAEDLDHGDELWRTDGDTTEMVADIWPGPGDSYPGWLTPIDGWVYFAASDPDHGGELWRTDGSTTEMVADVWPGSDGSRPGGFTPMDGWVYFSAWDLDHGDELWRTDGDTTERLTDIVVGPGSSYPIFLTPMGGSLFFGASLFDYETLPDPPLDSPWALWRFDPPRPWTGVFSDDDGSVFEGDVEWLAATGITRGCDPPDNTRFCPGRYVTRGQMAAFLHRGLAGLFTPGSAVEFTDDDGSIFEADIEWLGATGITRGCNPPDNTMFCPTRFVTRGQMAAFLVRALGYTDRGAGDLFTDDDDSIFEGDIDRLRTAGVTRGCNPPDNTMFCPDDYVTRGQMAAFLHRALSALPSPGAPIGVEASGPPCGGSGEVCVRWEPVTTSTVVAYTIYRGENGAVGGPIETVTVGDLYTPDSRFEYIDDLFLYPPTAPDPYPLCYAVAAVDTLGVTGTPSAPACTSPG
jgi:ELWxxDGT repeat protein